MASANQHHGEDEPLLGRPGDAAQEAHQNLAHNLWIGTAPLAQAGIWILAAVVWGAVFNSELILFSAHPLLNSAGILLLVQAILVLQPSHTPQQKRAGTLTHASLNATSLSTLLAGLIVIEYNKIAHSGSHFESPHAILGLVTYILLGIQGVVGFTQYWVPQLYGGTENAKSVWKYHRASGYVVLVLALATVAAATQTGFNVMSLHIELWAVIVASVLVLVGVLPRVKLQKLGVKS